MWAKLALHVISKFLFLAFLISSTPFLVLTNGKCILPSEYSKISMSLKILIDSYQIVKISKISRYVKTLYTSQH